MNLMRSLRNLVLTTVGLAAVLSIGYMGQRHGADLIAQLRGEGISEISYNDVRLPAAVAVAAATCAAGNARDCMATAYSLKEVDEWTEANAYAMRACRLERAQCATVVRHFSDHPQIEVALELAEQECEESGTFGQQSCAMVAAYHVQSGRVEKALAILDADCKRTHANSCVLASGIRLEQGDESGALASVKALCGEIGIQIEATDPETAEFAASACARLKEGQALTRAQANFISGVAMDYILEGSGPQ